LAVFSFFAKTEREWVNEREFVENTDDIMKKIGIDDDGFGHCCFRKYFSIFSTFLFLFRI